MSNVFNIVLEILMLHNICTDIYYYYVVSIAKFSRCHIKETC